MGKVNSDNNQFGRQAVSHERNGKFTQLKWQMPGEFVGLPQIHWSKRKGADPQTELIHRSNRGGNCH
jgi:hypothetical protein